MQKKKEAKKSTKTPGKGGKSKKGEEDDEDEEEAEEPKTRSKTAAGPPESAGKGDKTGKAKVKEKEKDEKEKEEEWHSDTSKEAQKKRKEAEFQAEVSDGQKLVDEILTSAKADNKSESPVTILKVFMASKERTAVEITGELRRLQLSRGLDDSQRIKTLLEALIDPTQPQQVVSVFKNQSALLKQLTSDKKSTSVFLACLEELVGVIEKKLLPRVPVILQTLYETDVLTEDSLLAWHSAPPESSWLVNKKVAAQVRSKAKPFIDWLKSAEEE